MSSLDALWKLLRTAVGVFWDLLTFFRLTFRTPQAVAAENLFLRKQLALYVERKTNPTVPPTPFVSPWLNFQDSSNGATLSLS